MFSKSFFALLLAAGTASAVALPGNPLTPKCTKTQVAILGAGVSGITAAQTLHNASISDFIIVEYNGEIGGRVAHTTFGKDSKGQPYTVELGANWVQGLGSEGGPENPIWTLAKKYGLKNTYSDYESILTFNGDGAANYTAKIDDFLEYYDKVEKDAGTMLTANAQDRSFRSGLLAEGWRPKWDMEKKAVEWWEFDWEYAYTPEQSSEEFSIIVSSYSMPSDPRTKSLEWKCEKGADQVQYKMAC
jgi:polyamine oxidase